MLTLHLIVFLSGIQKGVQQCCLAATFSLQVLIEHARIWGTSETNNDHFTELSSQLLDAVKRLAGHVIEIIEVCVTFNYAKLVFFIRYISWIFNLVL